MPYIRPACLYAFRHKRAKQLLYLIIAISLGISLFWIQMVQHIDQENDENLIQEALENIGRDFRYTDVYRKSNHLPKNLKFILLWSGADYAPLSFLGNGQNVFLRNNCSHYNCYVTDSRNFFEGDLTKFDAIAFNGRTLDAGDVPSMRSGHQKYIYFNMESSSNFPVCDEVYDSFFNWTATYRLDSDIPLPYIRIQNEEGEVIGPKADIEWITDLSDDEEDYADRIVNKTKAAAWFVSNCKTNVNRMSLVQKLQQSLASYGFTVDIYGRCGNLTCPRSLKSDCDLMLSRDYYFYMALENSFADDYVTEKVLNAMLLDIVPIVFGGADYSRFLPPDSYLDALIFEPDELAKVMNHLINSPKTYRKYFSWKKHYKYSDPSVTENVCSVCEALNSEKKLQPKAYPKFRKWWSPDYRSRCLSFWKGLIL